MLSLVIVDVESVLIVEVESVLIVDIVDVESTTVADVSVVSVLVLEQAVVSAISDSIRKANLAMFLWDFECITNSDFNIFNDER
ncbi:hypothetical protein GCM10027423_03080 [Spirosoma arcticum]